MLRKLGDWVAHRCGYYSPSDVEARLRSTDEVNESNCDAMQDHDQHGSRPSIPPGYVGYFISYADGSGGFGNCEIARGRPIETINDLMAISGHIASTLQIRSVVILNWRQFETEGQSGAKQPIADGAPENVVLRLVA